MNLDGIKSNLHLSGQFVADHISAMLAYWDKDLICRFANAAYIHWFGKSPDEMVDKISLPELLGDELFTKNLPYITAALQGEIQTFEREIPLPGGGTAHSIANYFPDTANGETRGFFVHVADISPVKILELELVKSNHIIREQNNRLFNFANIVSHNLRSYSNNLKSIVDLLVNAESEIERKELLTFLKGVSTEFSSTVSHLNEIVEVQNAGIIKAERIHLNTFINKSINALAIQIKTSKATVYNNVSDDLVIYGNSAYVESIILNLLTNAIKYRHPERNPLIEFDVLKNDQEFALTIKDNGRGIDLKKHGRDLFGMYKTFHGNADARGIGLFITKFQVETMGGHIEVQSIENNGSMFSVYFRLSSVRQENVEHSTI